MSLEALLSTVVAAVIGIPFTYWFIRHGKRFEQNLPPQAQVTYLVLGVLVAHKENASKTDQQAPFLPRSALLKHVVKEWDIKTGEADLLKNKRNKILLNNKINKINKEVEGRFNGALDYLKSPKSKKLEPLIEENNSGYQITPTGIKEYACIPEEIPVAERGDKLIETLNGSRAPSSTSIPSNKAVASLSNKKKPVRELTWKELDDLVLEVAISLTPSSEMISQTSVEAGVTNRCGQENVQKKQQRRIGRSFRKLNEGGINQNGKTYQLMLNEGSYRVVAKQQSDEPALPQTDIATDASDNPVRTEGSQQSEVEPPDQQEKASGIVKQPLKASEPSTVVDRNTPPPASKRSNTSVKDLISSGMLSPETRLVSHMKDWPAKATVLENGRIEYSGEQYDSPSRAGQAARNGKNVNGWTFWALHTADGPLLNTVREQYESSIQSDSAGGDAASDDRAEEASAVEAPISSAGSTDSQTRPENPQRRPWDQKRETRILGRSATLSDLIEEGMLHEGAILVHTASKYPGEATVTKGGKLKIGDQIYDTPSQAGEALQDGKSSSGWNAWAVMTSDGDLKKIFDLRAELVKRAEQRLSSG